jgi:hypothetical protein
MSSNKKQVGKIDAKGRAKMYFRLSQCLPHEFLTPSKSFSAIRDSGER